MHFKKINNYRYQVGTADKNVILKVKRKDRLS